MKFKRTLSILTGLMTTMSLASVLNVSAEGEPITSGDYTYTLNDDGEACLETYTGEATEVEIPSEIDGNPVIALGDTFCQTDVKKVTFNDTIERVGTNVFVASYSLEEIVVPEGNKEFESIDGVLFTEDMNFLICYPSAKTGESYDIPEGVTDIGIAAVYETQLKNITFPSTLEYIDRHGVSYNEKIEKIDLSNTQVVSLGDMAFTADASMTELILPDSLYEIGNATFAECTSLESVKLPESLAIIGQNAFAATGMMEITIPVSVQDIGYCAFGYDINLEPIDKFVIKGISGSQAQVYATDVDEDYGYANNFTFEATDHQIYEELESVAYGDFEYSEQNGEAYITFCDQSLTEVEIPSEIEGLPVTVIYGGAFYQSEVETVKLPDTIKKIEIMAFSDCDHLKNIDIPEGTEEIMAQAFYQCDSLETINIPSTCTIIGENSFTACKNLSAINVSEDNETFKSVDGIMFSKDGTELIKYPDNKGTEYKVPDSVKVISNYAFSENENLKEVNINKAETIGIDAFSFCTSLEKVKMGDNVKSIGDFAFYECEKLTQLELSSALETVGQYAVYQCKELKSVNLGDNITEIGECAFGYTYDESTAGNVAIDGFTVYANADTGGARYAETSGFEVIEGMTQVGGVNVNKGFLTVILSIAGVLVVTVIAVVIVKTKKKSAPQQTNKEGE